MDGLKTYTVAVVYLIAGVFVAMGWVPDADSAAGLNTSIASIVELLRNPLVAGLVLAIMRWWTQKTTIAKLERQAGFPTR